MSEPRLITRPGAGLAARLGPAILYVVDAADPAAAELIGAALQADNEAAANALFGVVQRHRPTPVTAFCALFLQADHVRVLMHGRAEVLADLNGEHVMLSGRDAESRIEESLTGRIAALAVSQSGPVLADQALVDFREGIVGAGSVELRWPASEASAPPAPAEAMPTMFGVPPPRAEDAQSGFGSRRTLAVPTAPAEVTQGTGGPEVDGVLCAAGHFNDPEASACVACGNALGEDLVRRPRPPLGKLLTRDGRAVIVTRPVVIGRNPALAPEVAANHAEGFSVPADRNSVSRVHADVLVDGWAVRLRDRRSANGTYVLPAGLSEWIRLEPEHATEIVHGTLIAVGDYEIKFDKP